MTSWLKENIIQMIIILITVTFGYANFTSKIESTAQAQIDLVKRVDKYEEKLDVAIKLLERIDERTSKR